MFEDGLLTWYQDTKCMHGVSIRLISFVQPVHKDDIITRENGWMVMQWTVHGGGVNGRNERSKEIVTGKMMCCHGIDIGIHARS